MIPLATLHVKTKQAEAAEPPSLQQVSPWETKAQVGVGKHQRFHGRLGQVGVQTHLPRVWAQPHTPGQHRALALIVKEAEAMTGAKCYEAPLGVQRDRSDGGWWQALDQHAGLEASRPEQRPCVGAQPLMALPRETLTVLEEVYAGHTDCLLGLHIAELKYQHLDPETGRAGSA